MGKQRGKHLLPSCDPRGRRVKRLRFIINHLPKIKELCGNTLVTPPQKIKLVLNPKLFLFLFPHVSNCNVKLNLSVMAGWILLSNFAPVKFELISDIECRENRYRSFRSAGPHQLLELSGGGFSFHLRSKGRLNTPRTSAVVKRDARTKAELIRDACEHSQL